MQLVRVHDTFTFNFIIYNLGKILNSLTNALGLMYLNWHSGSNLGWKLIP